MAGSELELRPVDFVTIDTIGPKGKRVFYLQAGKEAQIVTLIIEKEQALALSEAIGELLDDIDERFPPPGEETDSAVGADDMELREPLEPLFRVAEMGLGYDDETRMVVLLAQELVARENGEDDVEPGVVRLWCNRRQMRQLSSQASDCAQSGRADPRQNGRVVYYWS
ncbi:MAG: DUF3090 family protein [Anaerolineaceae bacterium]|nr:DUF3090 family protein [Anaerolineaceae bacterium]MDE0328378.1 DUF3090 family protein [Anaerolineaceae bacterium]